MRRYLLALGTVGMLAVVASPAEAQLRFGAHGALLTGLEEVQIAGQDINTINGTPGLGGRLMLDPPLLPFAVVGSGTYYLTDETEGSYWTGTVAGQLRLPLPIVKPYATAGWQVRKAEGADSQNGLMVGAGVQLDFMVSVFLEGTFEFNEGASISGQEIDTTPFVIKGGLLF